ARLAYLAYLARINFIGTTIVLYCVKNSPVEQLLNSRSQRQAHWLVRATVHGRAHANYGHVRHGDSPGDVGLVGHSGGQTATSIQACQAPPTHPPVGPSGIQVSSTTGLFDHTGLCDVHTE